MITDHGLTNDGEALPNLDFSRTLVAQENATFTSST
jgi:hypothetical protein